MKLPKGYNINADILRVLAGFGVVLIHVTDPFLVFPPLIASKGLSWELLNILNTGFRFVVPMFVVISGMFVLKQTANFDFNTFYSKRFTRVTIPFIFWVGFWIVWVNFMDRSLNLQQVGEMIVGANVDYLYFMYVIVALYFIAPLFIIFISNTKKVIHKYLFVSTVAFTLLLTASGFAFPNTRIDAALNAFTIFLPFIGYFIAGFYLKNKKLPKAYTLPFITFLVLLVFSMSLFSNGNLTHYMRNIGSVAIVSYTLILFMLVMQSEKLKQILNHDKTTKLIRFAAVSTFGVYLVHILIINLVDLVLPQWTVGNAGTSHISGLLIILPKILLVYTLSVLLTTVGRKIPYVRAIFGE